MIESKNVLNLIAAVGGIGIAASATAAPVALDTFEVFSGPASSFTGASDTGYTIGDGVSNFNTSSGGLANLTNGPITLAVGDVLSLTFDLSIPSGFNIPNPAGGGDLPSSFESAVRFGFVNEAGSNTTLLGSLDAGLTPAGTTMRILNNAGNGNPLSSGATLGTSSEVGTPITEGASDVTLSLVITRIAGASNYDIAVTWESGATAVGSDVVVAGAAPGPGVFDTVGIFFNNGNLPLDSQAVISNVAVDYTPIPEPGALALMSAGALMLFRRRSA